MVSFVESSTDDLDERECWELLALASVGRLALSVKALPAILPVQYYLDRPKLAICLGQHRLPEASNNDIVVAFAVDSIDGFTGSGWTVQVQGVLEVPLVGGVPTDCGQTVPGQVVHLEPVIINGHRFTLCPFIAGF